MDTSLAWRLGCTLSAWLRRTASLLPVLLPLLHCCCKQGLTVNERNHVTRAMVQCRVAVHTTFRLGSWLREVLWRAQWSWTWTWTWSASNVSQVLNLNLLLPLRLWVGWLRFFAPCQIPWVFGFFHGSSFLRFFSFFNGSSLLRFFSFFSSLRLVFKLVALLFAKAVIPTHMPRLAPNKGDLILFCNTKNR